MEEFVLCKTGANKMLAIIHEVKKRQNDAEEVWFFLTRFYLKRNGKKNLALLWEKKPNGRNKFNIIKTKEFQEVQLFWDTERIKKFIAENRDNHDDGRTFFINQRTRLVKNTHDRMDEEIIICFPPEKLEDIVKWFRFLLPAAKHQMV